MRTRKATAEKQPESQTRPKLHAVRPAPSPLDEPMPDYEAARRAARLADEYDAIRIKLAEFEAEKIRVEAELIAAMKAARKTNIGTMHGRVTLLPATASKSVPDTKAAVALLASHGISQPPTMEEWLGSHGLKIPMTDKPGMSDRIKFELNK